MAVRFWHGWQAAEACGCSQKQMGDEEMVPQTPDWPSTSCQEGAEAKARLGQRRGAAAEWTLANHFWENSIRQLQLTASRGSEAMDASGRGGKHSSGIRFPGEE
ncbi:hypothetical protein SRHO_G00169340 [Serrasalmus rhombeus]